MTTQLVSNPPKSDAGTANQDRKLMEQKLNSLSPKSVEKILSRPELKSGLIATVMRQPDAKLRDLARRVLGMDEEALGEIDIHQVADLFLKRRMTFSLDQLGNAALRWMKEPSIVLLVQKFKRLDMSTGNKIIFLVHDERDCVSIATVENKQSYFTVSIKELHEGPLFDGHCSRFAFRHPCPDILWRMYLKDEREEVSANDAAQLEDKAEFHWNSDPGIGKTLDSWPAGRKFTEDISRYYAMQNLNVPLGIAQCVENWDERSDERTLIGFSKTPRPFAGTVEADAWISEIRGMVAQMSDGECVLPDIQDLAERSVRSQVAGFALRNGLTFSEREVALFLRNAPAEVRNEGIVSIILAHNDKGEVFELYIRWQERRPRSVTVRQAELSSDFSRIKGSWALYLRVHATAAHVEIASVSLDAKWDDYFRAE